MKIKYYDIERDINILPMYRNNKYFNRFSLNNIQMNKLHKNLVKKWIMLVRIMKPLNNICLITLIV